MSQEMSRGKKKAREPAFGQLPRPGEGYDGLEAREGLRDFLEKLGGNGKDADGRKDDFQSRLGVNLGHRDECLNDLLHEYPLP